MTELASERTSYRVVEEEPPELAGRNLLTGAHLWASATAFFFIDFVFAYFYLRSINNANMWRPKHVDPSFTLGTLFTASLVAAAAVIWLGLKDQRAGRRAAWRAKGLIGLALYVVALALQIAEWTSQGFGPTDGGYASVYVGWTAFLFVFVIGLLFWLETAVATAIRYRRVPEGHSPPAGHGSGDPHRERHDIADPLSLVRPQLTAVSFYAQFMAAIAVITWIILYLA
jgi:heme/copper-type cytochrome/quinol oxidase subunit 3